MEEADINVNVLGSFDTLVATMNEARINNESKDFKIEAVRNFLAVYRESAPEFRSRWYETVMQFCTDDELEIDDSELTIEALETFLHRHYDRDHVFLCLPEGYAVQVVLSHANDWNFDFWGVRVGVGHLANLFSPVMDCFSSYCIQRNLCHDAEHFLKYGFRYSCKPQIFMDRCYDFQHRRYDHIIVNNLFGFGRMITFPKRKEMLLILDTFSAFAGPLATTNDRIKALCYIFRSVPDPYVHPDRMLELLENVVNFPFLEFLSTIVEEYRLYRRVATECFEQSDETHKPRLLKHLCRCQIRDVLADHMRLPDGIARLGLPRGVQEYLNLGPELYISE